MRSWMRSSSGSAAVVTTAYVASQAAGSSASREGSRHSSYTPASASTPPSEEVTKNGCWRGRPAPVARHRARLPLEPPVRRHEAPPGQGRPPVGRLVEQGLRAGVDHPAAGRAVLGPRRDQAPGAAGAAAEPPGRRAPRGAGARAPPAPAWSAPRFQSGGGQLVPGVGSPPVPPSPRTPRPGPPGAGWPHTCRTCRPACRTRAASGDAVSRDHDHRSPHRAPAARRPLLGGRDRGRSATPVREPRPRVRWSTRWPRRCGCRTTRSCWCARTARCARSRGPCSPSAACRA